MKIPKYHKKVYAYDPASPSSHGMKNDTSSSMSSINEIYETYKREKFSATKGNFR